MNKRQRLYTVLAGGTAVIMIAAGLLYINNRGVPAVEAAAYLDTTTKAMPVTEDPLQFLSDSSQGVPGMQLVAEDQGFALYYNEETTEIAVRDGKSGEIWYSNPKERAEDGLASAYEKEVLSSQLNVSFRDSMGTLENFPNFSSSISNKQFTVGQIDQGIRVNYTLGDTSLGIDALPKLISKQRLERESSFQAGCYCRKVHVCPILSNQEQSGYSGTAGWTDFEAACAEQDAGCF